MHYPLKSAAGKALGRRLSRYYNADAIVVAISRGAVEIGTEIAQSLHVPLRLLLVGKIKDPQYVKRVIGAVVVDQAPTYFYPNTMVDGRVHQEVKYVRYHVKLEQSLYDPFYGLPLEIQGKTVIIVDTSIHTGLAMQAAVTVVRQLQPSRLVIASIGLHHAGKVRLSSLADEIVSLENYYFTGKYSQYYLDYWPKDIATIRLRLQKAGGRFSKLLPRQVPSLVGRTP